MIYGIEDTTDLRASETKILKFTSKASALTWVGQLQGFAWPGSARDDIPVPQSNFHHRLRAVYDMPPGWRPPTPKEQASWVAQYRGSTYLRHGVDLIAQRIRRDGDPIHPST